MEYGMSLSANFMIGYCRICQLIFETRAVYGTLTLTLNVAHYHKETFLSDIAQLPNGSNFVFLLLPS